MTLRQKTICFVLIAIFLSSCKTQNQVATINHDLIADEFRYMPQGKKSDIHQWYIAWQDSVLSDLIQIGIEKNFSIQAALKRIEAANEYAKTARANLLPSVGVSGNFGYQDISIDNPLRNNSIISTLTPSKLSMNDGLVMLGFQASWEPDIFGKKTADADSAALSALSAQEEVQILKQAIAAKIAVLYFQVRANDETFQLIDENIKTIKELQRYAQGRFEAGQAQKTDILEAQMSIQKLVAQKNALSAQRAEQEQQLAVLTGQNPQTFRLPENKNKPNITPNAPTGFVPSDILLQRPDIRSKAIKIKVASANKASAQADLLPRFQLQFLSDTGRIGISSSGTDFQATLFNASIQLPIFTAGRIKHNIAAKQAELDAAIADYHQQVMEALQEVDSAYNTRILLAQRLQQLEAAYQTAQQRSTNQNRLYQNGYSLYHEVLRSQLDTQQIQQEIITTKRDCNLASIALYRALGDKPSENL